jgi:hypothetical protein
VERNSLTLVKKNKSKGHVSGSAYPTGPAANEQSDGRRRDHLIDAYE